jgi:hypothetical protein
MLTYLDSLVAFASVYLALSLVLTTIMQAVIFVTGMRQRILRLGLERILGRCFPDKKVTTLKSVVKGWMQHALIRNHLVGPKPDSIQSRELLMLVGEHLLQPLVSKKLAEDVKALNRVTAAIGAVDLADWQKGMDTVSGELDAAAKTLLPETRERLLAARDDLSATLAVCRSSFDSVMDRTSVIFTLWSRPITILLAIMGTWVLRIDAGYILEQITTQPAVREALVAYAGRQVADTPAAALDAKGTELQVATLALTGTWKALNFPEPEKVQPPATVTNRTTAAMWVMNGASGNVADSSIRQKALSTFFEQYEALSEEMLRSSMQRMQSMQAELSVTGIKVSRPRDELARLNQEQRSWYYYGLLASAALLSLGAPFWFNMLKQLLGLRSQVARKADEMAKNS